MTHKPPTTGPSERPLIVKYAWSLLLVQLAYKDQLIKHRSVIADYRLADQSIRYALASRRRQALDIAAQPSGRATRTKDDLEPARVTIETMLAKLLLAESDLLDTAAVLARVTLRVREHARTWWDEHAVPHEFLPDDDGPDTRAPPPPASSLLHRIRQLNPRDLAPESQRADTATAEGLASLRLLSDAELEALLRPRDAKRHIVEATDPREIGEKAFRAALSAAESPAKFLKMADEQRETRRGARAAQLLGALFRALPAHAGAQHTSGGLGLLGTFLRELGAHERHLESCLNLLASTRRTVTRWVGSVGPGYPILPSYHKQDRSQHYRAFHVTLEEAAATVAALGAFVRRPSETKHVTPPVPAFSFTDRTATTEFSVEEFYSVEYPAFYLDHPRYFSEGYHECAHASLPRDPPTSVDFRSDLDPAIDIAIQKLQLRRHRRLGAASAAGYATESLDDVPGRFEDTFVELLVDSMAAAACGPYFAVAQLLTGLTRTVWDEGADQLFLDPIARACSILNGGLAYWDLLDQNPDPTLGYIAGAAADLLDVHQHELLVRASGAGGEHLDEATRAANAAALFRSQAEPEMAQFVEDVLGELSTRAIPKSPKKTSAWLARRPRGHKLEEEWRAVEASVRHFTKELLGEDAPITGHVDDTSPFPLAVVVLPARDEDDGASDALVARNTVSIGWKWWLTVALTRWGVSCGTTGEDPTFRGRPQLLEHEQVEDAPLFAYLAATVQALRRRPKDDARLDRRRPFRDYFGIGAPLTLALYDCLWSKNVPLSECIAPTASQGERVLSVLGQFDLITVAARPPIDDLRSNRDEISRPPQPTLAEFYVRHADFEIVPLGPILEAIDAPETTHERLAQGYVLHNRPSSAATSEQAVKNLVNGAGLPGGGVFVLLQHVQRIRSNARAKNVLLGHHKAFHRALLRTDAEPGARRSAHLAALLRSYTWTDTALWWETQGDPVRALHEVLQQPTRSGPPPILVPLTETMVLYRQTDAYRAVVAELHGSRDAESALDRLLQNAKQHRWLTAPDAASRGLAIVFDTRFWITRGRGKNLSSLGGLESACRGTRRRVEAFKHLDPWTESRPSLHISAAAGAGDVVSRLTIPAVGDTPHAQAVVAILQQLVARSIATKTHAFEVVTHVELTHV